MKLDRILRVVQEETGSWSPRLQVAIGLSGLLPDLVGNRVRTVAFRAAGVRIGRGSVIGGHLSIAGRGRPEHQIEIGQRCWVNAGCYFDASGGIVIGDDVALAQDVLILTQSHDIGDHTRRAAALRTKPVRIGDGCWLGARATVLPGVTIGDGAIVAAGAVVSEDVPPDTLVAGVPARPIRTLL